MRAVLGRCVCPEASRRGRRACVGGVCQRRGPASPPSPLHPTPPHPTPPTPPHPPAPAPAPTHANTHTSHPSARSFLLSLPPPFLPSLPCPIHGRPSSRRAAPRPRTVSFTFLHYIFTIIIINSGYVFRSRSIQVAGVGGPNTPFLDAATRLYYKKHTRAPCPTNHGPALHPRSPSAPKPPQPRMHPRGR